jgi:hypothetical protein
VSSVRTAPARPRRENRSAAFRFVCACLAPPGEESDAALALSAVTPRLNWVEFVQHATDQLVAPAIAWRIERSGLRAVIPELVSRYVDAMLRLNTIRNSELQREAIEIVAALNGGDVIPLFIKGACGMLTGLYEDPGIRIMSDLDVLVPLSRAPHCVDRLEAIGFARSDTLDPPPHGLGAFSRAAGSAAIDLHRDVLAHPHDALLPARDVLQCAVHHRIDGLVFATPCPTHQVILNIGHAQLNDHGYAYGHLSLRSLHDLSLIVRRWRDDIDWEEIEHRFETWGLAHALEYHCLTLDRLLGVAPGTPHRSSLTTRLLIQRATFMVDHPRLQNISNRLIRVMILLIRNLSRPALRVRLMKNMRSRDWWARHLAVLWKGGRPA